MKHNIYTFAGLAAAAMALVLLTSCESGFEELNVDPTQANSMPPEFQLPTVQLGTAGTRYEMWRGNLIYSSAMVQHQANTWWAGAKYSEGSDDWRGAFWRVAYNGNGDSRRAYIKQVQDLIANNQDDPAQANFVAAARILRAFAFHRLTDFYGDIPYSEAGKGFLEDNVAPRFDPQSEIYPDLLNELAEAVAQFDDGAQAMGSADLMYGGDITRWQRFAHSLMLRLGLRLVKVDQGAALSWVEQAIAGGVMQSNADIAFVQHQSGPNVGPNGMNSNGNGDVYAVDAPLLSEFFVDYLKETDDPRLPILGARYDGPASSGDSEIVSTDPDDLYGWPFETDDQTVQNHPQWDDDLGYHGVFAQPNRLLRGLDEPTFFLTYAETEFMLAEAAVRGWHGGDPAAHYENGVRAAMEHLSLYDGDGLADIPAAAIDAYLATNPYDPANALEQINTQYWVATFLNGFEAWANYRRTGYPDFEPINYPGNPTGGTVPRRIMYPTSDQVLNKQHYDEAVARQGPDLMTTRIWWDAE